MANLLASDVEALNQATTAGEKYAILNKMYKSTNEKKYTNTELSTYLESGLKKDKFHTILYVYLVNHTKAAAIFVNLLKSEEDQLIWYTLKGCSFMWTDIKYGPPFYVSEIFPFISYSNRLKLLKEIARNLNNEQRSEEFFTELNSSYGSAMARPFLERCGSEFLMENLKRGIPLKPTELRRLLPQKFEFVIEYLLKLTVLADDEKSILYSADLLKYKKLVRKLCIQDHYNAVNNNKKIFKTVLGKKLSKRILTSNAKKFIIEDSQYFREIIPKSMIYKYLSKEDFYIFFKNLFPDTFFSYNHYVYEYLDYYKNKEEKLNLLLTAYKEAYGEELLDKLTNVSENVLGLLDTERRIEYATKLIEKTKMDEGDIDYYVCFLPCKISLAKFKKCIYSTSDIEKRTGYLGLMLQTCGINDDMDALLEVLTYFNQRHRNDNHELVRTFADDIALKVDVKKLTEKHYEEIVKIMDIVSLNNDWVFIYYANTLFIEHIKYNHMNNLPAKKSHIIYIKFLHRSLWCNGRPMVWNLFPENKLIGKKSLCAMGEILPEVWDKISKRTTLSFLEAITSWNKKNPNDTVSAINFPWLIKNLTEMIGKKKRFLLESIFEHLQHDKLALNVLGSSEFEPLKLNLKHFRNTIRTDSELIRKNMKEICHEILNLKQPRKHFFPLLRRGELKLVDGLEKYLKNYCLNIVNTEISDREPNKLKPSAMRILIHWLGPEEFFSIARFYYPIKLEAPVGSDTAVTKYNFQKFIAFGIKYYKDSPEAFVAIKRFCIGDYLKLAIGSLKSVCIKTTFKKSDEFLNSCIDTPVSLKKHIIRLKFILHNKAERLNFLRSMWTSEKNRSIREIILKYVIQLFKSERETMLWSLLKDIFDSLTSQDFYITEILTEFKDIPKGYYSLYIELCWTTINRLEPETKDVKASKILLLSSLESSLGSFAPEVVDKLLTENLFKMGTNMDVQNAFCSLAAKYILHYSENEQDQDNRFDVIICKIKEALDTNWSNMKTVIRCRKECATYPVRTNINRLIDHISKYFAEEESADCKIITRFQEKFNGICEPEILMYSSYLKLEMVLIFKKCNKDLIEFGKCVRDLLDGHISVYGEYCVPLFSDALKSLPMEVQAIEIVNGLLCEPLQSNGCALLALHFLEFNVIRGTENRHLLDRLIQVNDRKVQKMLNGYN